MVSEDQENAREGLILKVIYLSQKDASHNATTLFSENLAENNFQRKKMKASVVFYWRYSSIVVLVAQSCLTFCDPMDPTKLLCPWDSPGKNTGVGCCSICQAIFPTWGSNSGLLHCRQILWRYNIMYILEI